MTPDTSIGSYQTFGSKRIGTTYVEDSDDIKRFKHMSANLINRMETTVPEGRRRSLAMTAVEEAYRHIEAAINLLEDDEPFPTGS